MPRRGENIRKRKDGRWEARYPNGRNEKGNKIYASVYGRTYREVKEKRQLIMNQDRLSECIKEMHIFEEILELWLEDNQIRLKEATKYRYRYLVETHILPELGGMKVNQLTGNIINCYLAEKIKSGRLDGTGGLSPITFNLYTYNSMVLIIQKKLSGAVSIHFKQH